MLSESLWRCLQALEEVSALHSPQHSAPKPARQPSDPQLPARPHLAAPMLLAALSARPARPQQAALASQRLRLAHPAPAPCLAAPRRHRPLAVARPLALAAHLLQRSHLPRARQRLAVLAPRPLAPAAPPLAAPAHRPLDPQEVRPSTRRLPGSQLARAGLANAVVKSCSHLKKSAAYRLVWASSPQGGWPVCTQLHLLWHARGIWCCSILSILGAHDKSVRQWCRQPILQPRHERLPADRRPAAAGCAWACSR